MNGEKSLQKHLSPLGARAFSLGTSIGWGSLPVTVRPEDAAAVEVLLRKERLKEESGPLETARVRSMDKHHILAGVQTE